jgi:hypothetical protein
MIMIERRFAEPVDRDQQVGMESSARPDPPVDVLAGG